MSLLALQAICFNRQCQTGPRRSMTPPVPSSLKLTHQASCTATHHSQAARRRDFLATQTQLMCSSRCCTSHCTGPQSLPNSSPPACPQPRLPGLTTPAQPPALHHCCSSSGTWRCGTARSWRLHPVRVLDHQSLSKHPCSWQSQSAKLRRATPRYPRLAGL